MVTAHLQRRLQRMVDPTRFRREDDTPRLPPPPLWVIPALTLTLLAILTFTVPAPSLAPVLAFAAFAPSLAWVDADVHRLPDALTRPATVTVAAAIIGTTLVAGTCDNTGRAVIGAGVAAATMFVLALIAGVGLGDLKLAIPLIASAAWHSWPTAFWAFLAGWVFNAAIVLALCAAGRRERHNPLGPPLILGWICAIAVAAPLNL